MVGPGLVDLPVPGLAGYMERPSRLGTLETDRYYNLVKSAGTDMPVGPTGTLLPLIQCPESNCLAGFHAFWRGPAMACPVCRRKFRPQA